MLLIINVITQFIDHKLVEMQLANTHRLVINFANSMNYDIRTYLTTSSPTIRAGFMAIDQDSYKWLHTYYTN